MKVENFIHTRGCIKARPSICSKFPHSFCQTEAFEVSNLRSHVFGATIHTESHRAIAYPVINDNKQLVEGRYICYFILFDRLSHNPLSVENICSSLGRWGFVG